MSQKNQSAKFAFYYVLSLVALGFVAISVGMIIFQIINKELVDIVNQYSTRFSDEQLKFAISALIITTPIYYLVSRQIFKNLYKGDLDENSGIRRWLTYLILLVAAIVMIVNVIGTLNGFLDGQLTTNSILKTITVLAIAGGVFAFYFYDIKREDIKDKKDKLINIFSYTSLAIVIIVFVSAWFYADPPDYSRDKKIDSGIVNDLNDIYFSVQSYYTVNGELPADLSLLERQWSDPRTGEAYEYEVVSADKYKICAEFKTSNLDEEEFRTPVNTEQYISVHDSGYKCFEQKMLNKEDYLLDGTKGEVMLK